MRPQILTVDIPRTMGGSRAEWAVKRGLDDSGVCARTVYDLDTIALI